MIDISHMVERFLDEAVLQCNEDGKEDEVVISSLNDRNQSAANRREKVLKWLLSYEVLRGLNAAERDAVASVIVEFADARVPIGSPLSEDEIIKKFDDLHTKCSSKVHPRKNGKPRSLTSLTSKALWCCYPYAIPLFDSYAQRALWVVSRLMGFDRPPEKDDDIPPYTRESVVKSVSWRHD